MPDRAQDEQIFVIRQALSDAYAALEGARAVQSLSVFTLEDALDAQAQRLEGPDTTARPNALHRIDAIVSNVEAAVLAIKALPPHTFTKGSPEDAVNTKP